MFRFITIAAILALGALSAQAGPSAQIGNSAQADAAAGGNSVAVPFGDLDLTQPADARMLVQRLRRAARTVCSPGDILQQSYCVDRAARDAFSQALVRQAAAGSAGKFVRR